MKDTKERAEDHCGEDDEGEGGRHDHVAVLELVVDPQDEAEGDGATNHSGEPDED